MKWLHPDPLDMWKMTMCLSDIVRACGDPSKRLPRQVCHLSNGCLLKQHEHTWLHRWHHREQDVTVGKPVSARLAKAVFTPQQAVEAMKGRPSFLETKFDGEMCTACVRHASAAGEPLEKLSCCRAGERLQLHCNGASMQWFGGRNGIDHGTRSHYSILDPVITQRVRSTKFVLDGELLVWNHVR